MLPLGNVKVQIVSVDVIRMDPPENDPTDFHRFVVEIDGKLKDGQTTTGRLYLTNKAIQRSFQTLIEIGLPNGDLTKVDSLIGKFCSFKIEEKPSYNDPSIMVREVAFINGCRDSVPKEKLGSIMSGFNLASPAPSQGSAPPRFEPPKGLPQPQTGFPAQG